MCECVCDARLSDLTVRFRFNFWPNDIQCILINMPSWIVRSLNCPYFVLHVAECVDYVLFSTHPFSLQFLYVFFFFVDGSIVITIIIIILFIEKCLRAGRRIFHFCIHFWRNKSVLCAYLHTKAKHTQPSHSCTIVRPELQRTIFVFIFFHTFILSELVCVCLLVCSMCSSPILYTILYVDGVLKRFYCLSEYSVYIA